MASSDTRTRVDSACMTRGFVETVEEYDLESDRVGSTTARAITPDGRDQDPCLFQSC